MTLSDEAKIKTFSPGEITMYGADWCGDCRRAKAYFAEHDVAYEYIDLEANPDEVDRVLERNGGVKKIPVVVFADDSHLVEPSNADLETKLTELTAAGSSQSAAEAGGRVVVDNADRQRFELRAGHSDDAEVLSFATYAADGSSLVVPHVETKMEHRGNGFADELMAGVVENLRTTDRNILPLCPFAAQYLRDRPDDHDVLASR